MLFVIHLKFVLRIIVREKKHTLACSLIKYVLGNHFPLQMATDSLVYNKNKYSQHAAGLVNRQLIR